MPRSPAVHTHPEAPRPTAKKRARVRDDAPPAPTHQRPPAAMQAGTRLEPHICRVCHSRLCSHPASDGSRIYECTNCGMAQAAHTPSVLCCCGMKLRKPGKSGRPGAAEVDAGVRCIPNPAPTPEFPSLYVAGQLPPKGR